MTRKSFFTERTVTEIRRLNNKRVDTARNLVRKILDLDPSVDGLELMIKITPEKFFINSKSGAEASTKCYKHGDLIALSHPKTKKECDDSSDIPLSIRARDFNKLELMNEEDINIIGYSFQPTWGDRIKRVVHFAWCTEGVRLFGYAENMTQGITVEFYKDSRRARKEGASIVVEVPSRTKDNPRYKFRLINIPVLRSDENLATVLSLKPAIMQDLETGEPIKGRTPHDIYNIKYVWETTRERSEVITFYPHDIAAYLAIVKDQWKKHNLTPIEMNPFALPSRREAEFYRSLCNNIIIFDPSLTGKEKRRKLHLDERCILIARSIKVLGHDESVYWDPSRDGKLKEYEWNI